MRLVSCFGVHLDLIRPFGFIFEDKKLKRAGMDYIKFVDYEIHNSFDDFLEKYQDRRPIALDIGDNSVTYHDFEYQPTDALIVGSEHYGFLKEDLKKISWRVKIPILPGRRSLNMATAAAIVLSQAMIQLDLYAKNQPIINTGMP